jgi:hypothetical protein
LDFLERRVELDGDAAAVEDKLARAEKARVGG